MSEHDETGSELSRRVFVHRLSFFGGGVVLLGCAEKAVPDAGQPKPKLQAKTSDHLTFTDEEFAALSAACDRVLPKDEDPGALEANVPVYIDRILQTPELRKMKDDFIPGLAALDRRAMRQFNKPFAECAAAQQDTLITAFKNSDPKSGEARWYEMLIVLSLEGFLGDPSYGGNKDQVGWALVGFELVGRAAAEPPPGYDGRKHLHDARCGGGKGC